MGAVTMLVSLDQYLRTGYEHDREWVDGEVRQRAMPDGFHAAIQQFFLIYFGMRALELGVRVRPELRVRVSAGRYRIPDVTVMSTSVPEQSVPDIAPFLCIEILSPDDSWSEMQEKIDDYVAMGVGAIWIVDPRRRTMYVAGRTGTHAVDIFRLAGTTVNIASAELFAEVEGIVE